MTVSKTDYEMMKQHNEMLDEIIDTDFDNFGYDSELRDISDKVVDYWEEDYPFEDLLEEFELTTKDAFYALLQTGMIDPERLEAFTIGE